MCNMPRKTHINKIIVNDKSLSNNKGCLVKIFLVKNGVNLFVKTPRKTWCE
jgi:hypothetical protein